MIPVEFRPNPAGPGREFAEQLGMCSNAFAAAATAALLAEPDALLDVEAANLESDLSRLLPLVGARWDSEARAAVVDLVRIAGLPEAAAAAVVAECLDRTLGPRFGELPTYPSVWDLDPGDPFPVRVPPPLTDDGRRSPHPFSLPRRGRDLRNLRFAPENLSGYHLTIHWRIEHAEVLPASLGKIGTGHPNLDLSEFGIPAVNDGTFFGFPNRDPLQSDWVDTAAALAMDGTSVVVLPELSVDSSDVTRVVDAWKAVDADRRPAVFVPGSAHIETGASRVNRAEIHVRGMTEPIMVDKQEPFRMLGHSEGIDTGPLRLDIHVVGAWRIAGAICRDVLRPGVPGLLAQLGVSLLVVPTMSPSTANFSVLNVIPSRNWGIAVVSNNPAVWPVRPPNHPNAQEPPQALVLWPLEGVPGLATETGRSEAAVRGAWHFDVTDGTVSSAT